MESNAVLNMKFVRLQLDDVIAASEVQFIGVNSKKNKVLFVRMQRKVTFLQFSREREMARHVGEDCLLTVVMSCAGG